MSDVTEKTPLQETGTISVSTENIFPIIKQSLYSEQEIFLRELISNAVDASQKLKYLSSTGEFEGEVGELEVGIAIDKEAKTLTVSDRGIGMNGEEVKKYINQVAFSGAEEFVNKFKDAAESEEIIGKFGLGFYSAFMVSDQVEVVTRSYREDDAAVRWTCDGSTSYTLEAGARADRGTDVILHLSEDALGYLEPSRIQTILNKYARFLPIPIKFEDKQINETEPIWRKKPTELTDEQYLDFFRTLYPMEEEPLFWIHLNVDFPFTLTGVLYFPKIKKDIDPRRNSIQLYSRQVFITDEVKDIVPDYLMLLQGVIDSPDIPLNVSRSYLQGDPNVKKISNYITKKVAGKLNELFKDDLEQFEQKWNDISVFVKYGMLTDEKFYDRAEKFCLLQNVDGEFFDLTTYREKIAPLQTDKDENVVYLYTTNKGQQDLYIQHAKSRHYDILEMDGVVDSHFIGHLERKFEKSRFTRVDADTLDKLIPKGEQGPDEGLILTEDQENRIKAIFEAAKPANMTVQLETLSAEELPVQITQPEFMRRMKEMAQLGGGMGMMGGMPDSFNLVINTRHPLIYGMIDKEDNAAEARQLVDLALLSQQMLKGENLTSFIRRSLNLLKEE
ncbi:MAG: molecular chaperone HtpG [Bacteroidota bacterium]